MQRGERVSWGDRPARVPAVAKGPVRAAGAVSALVVLFSAPLVARLGQRPTNSSTLPIAYERNAAIILIGVWVLAGAFIALRVARARRA